MQAYIGDIITYVRRDTRSADDIPSASVSVGINTEDFLRYANWAQQRLQGRITKVYPQVFETTSTISLVASQAGYVIPDNLYLGTRIKKVEYASSGVSTDFTPLLPANPYSTNNSTGYPSRYHRQNGVVTLEPTPSTATGSIKVTYERALDRLDIRRGVVTVATVVGGALTVLSVSTTTDDEIALANPVSRYLCINDANGNVKMYNVPFTSYNSGTGAFTLSSYTFAAGEAVAVGDYVTLGKYTTTHSKLPDDAERYLAEYMTRRIKKRESSSDASGVDTELNDIEQEIVGSFKIADKDVKPIPIGDYTLAVTDFSGWDS